MTTTGGRGRVTAAVEIQDGRRSAGGGAEGETPIQDACGTGGRESGMDSINGAWFCQKRGSDLKLAPLFTGFLRKICVKANANSGAICTRFSRCGP